MKWKEMREPYVFTALPVKRVFLKYQSIAIWPCSLTRSGQSLSDLFVAVEVGLAPFLETSELSGSVVTIMRRCRVMLESHAVGSEEDQGEASEPRE